ncbi:MAG TPA: MarR family transcriptional regulator, partial [Chloroflexota bacterium]
LQESAALTLSQFRTLLLLSQVPQGRHMQDLANALAISKSGLTRLVDRLQSAGLVERVASPSDRRVVLARITPAGSELLGRVLPAYRGTLGSSFGACLGPRELDSLVRALQRLVEGLESDDSAA